MTKRMISLLLAFAMILGMLPMTSLTASAAGETFTRQPESGWVENGNLTVTWATNFTPVQLQLMGYTSATEKRVSRYLTSSATSAQISSYTDHYDHGYCIRAYYSASGYVDSDKFYVINGEPVFTKQPQSGEVAVGEKLAVTWQTSFTPAKQVLVKVIVHPVDGEVKSYETLAAGAVSVEVSAGYAFYAIRSYYTDSQFVTSAAFTVTQKAPFTSDSTFLVGGKMTVDVERVAESDEVWMDAYFNDAITCKWYRDGAVITGASGVSYIPVEADLGHEIHAELSCGSKSILSFAKVIAPGAQPEEPEEPQGPYLTQVIRIGGVDRTDTSKRLADELQWATYRTSVDAIIVASAMNFPDALTGSYLAAVLGAPILLTFPQSPWDTRQYIEQNMNPGGMVYILGGESAVSKEFEDLLTERGISSKRLAGTDRFGTNLAIMKEAGITQDQPVLICTATGFADSLSASAAGLPMILVHGSLRPDQKAFLQASSRKVVIIGGTSAVSTSIEKELKAIGSVERLAGNGRYETSVLVAKRFCPDPDAVVLAYARNYPDGLCGGPLAYVLNAPLILTDDYGCAIADEYVKGINAGVVVGGTGLVSDRVTREIFDLDPNALILGK